MKVRTEINLLLFGPMLYGSTTLVASGMYLIATDRRLFGAVVVGLGAFVGSITAFLWRRDL